MENKKYEDELAEVGIEIIERTETSILFDVTDLVHNIHRIGFTIND